MKAGRQSQGRDAEESDWLRKEKLPKGIQGKAFRPRKGTSKQNRGL